MRPKLFPRITIIAITVVAITCWLAYTDHSSARSVYLASPPTVTMVATGLHNPRGLNFAPDGSLYVAEAAGDGEASDDCGVMGDGSTKCSANTGSVTRIDLGSGESTRVLTGLPSLIAANGSSAGGSGPQDVVFQGMGNGYITIGLGGAPEDREEYFGDAGAFYGRLVRFNPSGRVRFNEDIAGYELENNPDGFVPDSNPFGMAAVPGAVIVADAGGNDLLKVAANGTISTLAVFPTFPNLPGLPGPPNVQAVPTSVTVGPDGDYYVGQLTGFPFIPGRANVYRVAADGGDPEVAYSGFTNIIDVTFGPDGSLYVLEIAAAAIPNFGTGRLVRIAPDGTQSTVIGSLFAPGGVAVGKDGSIYVTVGSITPAGAVIKIVP
ncbi:MAG TPA: ScyD/ScyE family protein [Pyrinomonadaceae bacterium]